MHLSNPLRRLWGAPRTPVHPKRQWTVVIVPEGSGATRTFNVSRGVVRAVGALSTIVAVVIAAAGVTVGLDMTGHSPFADAGARHQARVLATLRAQVATLSDTVTRMASREAQVRTLAGLETRDSLIAASTGTVGGTTRVPNEDVEALIQRASVLAASFADASVALRRDAERAARTPSIMPTTGWLTSQFSLSRFHPILHINRPHEGIDIAAPYGMPVVAPAAGTVVRVTRQNGYGLVLEIDHGNGILTKYAHLSRALVRPGQRVVRGDPIADVGNSGLSTGPHLHYEVHVGGKVVDPLTYMLPESIPN